MCHSMKDFLVYLIIESYLWVIEQTVYLFISEKRGHGVDELVATMVVLVTTVEL